MTNITDAVSRNHCVWSKRIGWQIVHEKSYRQKSLIFKEVAV